jgi:hypothetical protein
MLVIKHTAAVGVAATVEVKRMAVVGTAATAGVIWRTAVVVTAIAAATPVWRAAARDMVQGTAALPVMLQAAIGSLRIHRPHLRK